MENSNYIIPVKGQDIIGVLCVNEKREAFLQYLNKYSTEPIEYGDQNHRIDAVHNSAQEFCKTHNFNLIMY